MSRITLYFQTPKPGQAKGDVYIASLARKNNEQLAVATELLDVILNLRAYEEVELVGQIPLDQFKALEVVAEDMGKTLIISENTLDFF